VVADIAKLSVGGRRTTPASWPPTTRRTCRPRRVPRPLVRRRRQKPRAAGRSIGGRVPAHVRRPRPDDWASCSAVRTSATPCPPSTSCCGRARRGPGHHRPTSDRPDTRPRAGPDSVRTGGGRDVRPAGQPGRPHRDRVHLRPPGRHRRARRPACWRHPGRARGAHRPVPGRADRWRWSPSGRRNRRVDLAYATTGHRDQGLTRWRALVRLTGSEDANWLYVQLSRARQDTRLYAVVGPEPQAGRAGPARPRGRRRLRPARLGAFPRRRPAVGDRHAEHPGPAAAVHRRVAGGTRPAARPAGPGAPGPDPGAGAGQRPPGRGRAGPGAAHQQGRTAASGPQDAWAASAR
jgi:hypothetical protein